MRSFQFTTLLLFLVFYLIISMAGNKNLVSLLFGKVRNKKRWMIWLPTLFIFIGMIILYIYPFSPRESTNYKLYFWFNISLIVDFIGKLMLSLGYVISFAIPKNKLAVRKGSLILATGIAATLILGMTIGRISIHTKHITLYFNNLPDSFNNFQIVQISDIHLGSYADGRKTLARMVGNIEKTSPDMIVLTGDLFNNFSTEVEKYKEILSRLPEIATVYSILGNHDYGNYSNWKSETEKELNFKNIVLAHKELGFNILKNENRILKQGSDSIFIAGVENWGKPPFPQYGELEKALGNIPEGSFELLLSHDPTHWEYKIKDKRNIELTFSGHTHGFQLGFKLAGITFSPAYLSRKYWSGIYGHKNNYLYVNQGFGIVGIPFRIDMPSEITVFTLKRIKIN